MSTDSSTHFSLASRSLKLDSEADIHPHLTPLHASPSPPQITPTSISLNGNTLGVSACEALAKTLRAHPQLETANFADIFTSRLLSEIPPALDHLLGACATLPRLHTIDLSDNAFGLNTVAPLVTFLERHVPLRHLILQNNGLGPAAGAKVADALTELARRKKEAGTGSSGDGKEVGYLETVICGRNRLESGSMASWAKAVTAHASGLKTIKMVQNGIRQDGIKLLLEDGLANCEGLQVLDLQDNTFTVTGARALAGVVGKWKGLKELGVGDCLLGGRGAVSLAKELAKPGVGESLEVLRAQYNEIDSRGVGELFVAADKGGLVRLRRVELNGNKFAEDDAGVEGLRELLEKRKEENTTTTEGDEESEEGYLEWGLDDLSDLEEEDSDDEVEEGDEDDGNEEAEVEQEAKQETILKDADNAENAQVAQRRDEDVDALAEQLGGTHVK